MRKKNTAITITTKIKMTIKKEKIERKEREGRKRGYELRSMYAHAPSSPNL